ncbi:protein BIG GRAIN 1-like B [Cornus florida]|uniref:protein BIG GRAIN 1-like B n=1 Tax=Cornus florida TaxID=4283 RepID=UPI002897DF0E|nr:protein BIG GRAIN 1-like B [Cornus florida]
MKYSSSINQEMERWDRYRCRREPENPNPSFSSTLLDAIYRSIDEDGEREEEVVFYRETTRKKHSNCAFKADTAMDEDMASLQRACMIEKWMDKKKVSEKLVLRRNSAPEFERKRRDHHGGGRGESWFLNSSSSSSDSSSGGGFSSSEAESVYGHPARSSAGGGVAHRLSPIRTSSSAHQHEKYSTVTKPESGFKCSKKSKSLKNIYGDLKKVKQPVSPGARLSSFLNSIFSAGNAKKAKVSSSSSSSPEIKYSNSAHSSTCSSATSFSRSCLSKTPSSRGTLSNGTKRSVRFYPISVIVDEDCQPCGHKSLYEDEPSLEKIKDIRNSINEELQLHIMEKHRRVEEAARELLRNYQKKVECEFDMRGGVCNKKNNNEVFDDDYDDDDGASCASSDLFELDNLSVIGIDGYSEELPVYETTHLDTNRAIANGLLV